MAGPNWWILLTAALFFGLFTRTYPLAAFILMLMAISGVADGWRRRSLRGVNLRRVFTYQRGYPGESIPMKYEAENRKFLPLPWLRVSDLIPYDIAPQDENLIAPTHLPDRGLLISLYSLRWFERDRRSYTLLLRKRGIYRLGPAQPRIR